MSAVFRDYFTSRSPAGSAERMLAAIGVTGAAVGAFVIQHFNPVTAGFFPKCPFFLITGCYCPGCGTTRGLHALFNGDIAGAAGYNLLMVMTLPILAWLFVSFALVAVRGRALPRVWIPVPIIWAMFYIVVGFWILRNIPVYPLNLLAP